MQMKKTIGSILLFTIFWCGYNFADEDKNTSSASGGDQIIVSPMSTMLDVSDTVSVNVLVLNENGNPIEGRNVRIVLQDSKKVSVNINHSISDESGYISFYILGKQQGNTVVTVTDGAVSSQIDVAVRNLINYVLPYFFGDMQLSIINPTEELNYVKIQFYENSDRIIEPVIVRLEGKEMKSVSLSEELDITLKDGWAEINSTEPIFGGIWTSKGYLSFKKIEE
ncbi:MAG: Ig-like domain-containing protein [Planctomycetota bacterium]